MEELNNSGASAVETTSTGAENTQNASESTNSGAVSEKSAAATPSFRETIAAKLEKVEKSASEVEKPGASVADTAEYKPNFKYKVHDQEKEFEDWIKAGIKDAETEKKARELYEKIDGFEVIKPKYEQRTQELETLKSEFSPIKAGIATLKEHVRSDDYDSFFRDLNIPADKIYQWVAKKLQYENLSPEDKKRYDNEIESKRQTQTLQKENEGYKTQLYESAVRSKESELNLVLSSPEANKAMQGFDARMGKIGAFRDQVAQYALGIEISQKRDVSAKEAVEAVMGLMGFSGQAGQDNTQATGSNVVIQQNNKPVIPNIKSRGGSPVKKKPTSLDEMRSQAQARINELNGNG